MPISNPATGLPEVQPNLEHRANRSSIDPINDLDFAAIVGSLAAYLTPVPAVPPSPSAKGPTAGPDGAADNPMSGESFKTLASAASGRKTDVGRSIAHSADSKPQQTDAIKQPIKGQSRRYEKLPAAPNSASSRPRAAAPAQRPPAAPIQKGSRIPQQNGDLGLSERLAGDLLSRANNSLSAERNMQGAPPVASEMEFPVETKVDMGDPRPTKAANGNVPNESSSKSINTIGIQPSKLVRVGPDRVPKAAVVPSLTVEPTQASIEEPSPNEVDDSASTIHEPPPVPYLKEHLTSTGLDDASIRKSASVIDPHEDNPEFSEWRSQASVGESSTNGVEAPAQRQDSPFDVPAKTSPTNDARKEIESRSTLENGRSEKEVRAQPVQPDKKSQLAEGLNSQRALARKNSNGPIIVSDGSQEVEETVPTNPSAADGVKPQKAESQTSFDASVFVSAESEGVEALLPASPSVVPSPRQTTQHVDDEVVQSSYGAPIPVEAATSAQEEVANNTLELKSGIPHTKAVSRPPSESGNEITPASHDAAIYTGNTRSAFPDVNTGNSVPIALEPDTENFGDRLHPILRSESRIDTIQPAVDRAPTESRPEAVTAKEPREMSEARPISAFNSGDRETVAQAEQIEPTLNKIPDVTTETSIQPDAPPSQTDMSAYFSRGSHTDDFPDGNQSHSPNTAVNDHLSDETARSQIEPIEKLTHNISGSISAEFENRNERFEHSQKSSETTPERISHPRPVQERKTQSTQNKPALNKDKVETSAPLSELKAASTEVHPDASKMEQPQKVVHLPGQIARTAAIESYTRASQMELSQKVEAPVHAEEIVQDLADVSTSFGGAASAIPSYANQIEEPRSFHKPDTKQISAQTDQREIVANTPEQYDQGFNRVASLKAVQVPAVAEKAEVDPSIEIHSWQEPAQIVKVASDPERATNPEVEPSIEIGLATESAESVTVPMEFDIEPLTASTNPQPANKTDLNVAEAVATPPLLKAPTGSSIPNNPTFDTKQVETAVVSPELTNSQSTPSGPVSTSIASKEGQAQAASFGLRKSDNIATAPTGEVSAQPDERAVRVSERGSLESASEMVVQTESKSSEMTPVSREIPPSQPEHLASEKATNPTRTAPETNEDDPMPPAHNSSESQFVSMSVQNSLPTEADQPAPNSLRAVGASHPKYLASVAANVFHEKKENPVTDHGQLENLVNTVSARDHVSLTIPFEANGQSIRNIDNHVERLFAALKVYTREITAEVETVVAPQLIKTEPAREAEVQSPAISEQSESVSVEHGVPQSTRKADPKERSWPIDAGKTQVEEAPKSHFAMQSGDPVSNNLRLSPAKPVEFDPIMPNQSSTVIDLPARITRMAIALQPGETSQLRMRLDPPSLGAIHVQIDSLDNGVSVRIVTQSHEASRLIHESQMHLSDTLAQWGLNLSSFSTSVGQDQRHTPAWDWQGNPGRPNSQAHTSAERRTEVQETQSLASIVSESATLDARV